MKIILMRHGEAQRQTLNDSQRQLTDFGRKQAEQTAQYLLDKYSPDHYVVSPYDRAQQTLNAVTILLEKTTQPQVTVLENITPNDAAQPALETLYHLQGHCIFVVSHMPIVAKLAGLLSGTEPDAYMLAEARVFEAEFFAENMGTEIDRFVPKQA